MKKYILKKNINVTKPFAPPLRKYISLLKSIWGHNVFTNNGVCVQTLEDEISNYTNLKNISLVSNGTIAIQIALNSLGIKKNSEIITTPFTYIATTSSILWEGYKPIFADIDKDTFCIDPNEIEKKITKNTKAILAVHVFGNPCNIKRINLIAKKYNLYVIYDGAHAFGCEFKSKSLLSFGDLTTCSFHATKVFSTAEGGLINCRNKKTLGIVSSIKRFGHYGDKYSHIGINGKMSELHAALGLCNLQYLKSNIKKRFYISELYDQLLENLYREKVITRQLKAEGLIYNYSYYPILFNSEKGLNKVLKVLGDNDIYPRRYFYPSLDTMPFINNQICNISRSISSRVLCMPIYESLTTKEVIKICKLLVSSI